MIWEILDFVFHGIMIAWEFVISVDIAKSINIIKDLLTIVGIIVGLYFGNKSLRKYLMDEYIKKKIHEISDANNSVASLTRKIISEIDILDIENEISTQEDFDFITTRAYEIHKATSLAGIEVNTLSHFFLSTWRKVQPIMIKNSSFRAFPKIDVYDLFYNYLMLQNELSSNIIIFPKKVEVEPYHKRFKIFQSPNIKDKYYRLSDFEFGLKTREHFSLQVRFLNVLINSRADYIFHRNFFSILKGNDSILFLLAKLEYYVPSRYRVILPINTPFFENEKVQFLHLIKFELSDQLIPVHEKQINLYYSNLSNIHFVESFKGDEIDGDYAPANEPMINIFKMDIRFKIIDYETIVVTLPLKVVQEYYSQNVKMIENKLNLIADKENSN